MIKRKVELKKDEYGETIQENNNGKIHIQYERPLASRRFFSALIDFFVFLLIAGISFVSTRAIVNVTPYYSNQYNLYNNTRMDSGLYTRPSASNSKSYDVVYYYTKVVELTPTNIKNNLKSVITNTYLKYIELYGDSSIDVNAKYNEFLKNAKYQSTNLFRYDEIEQAYVESYNGADSARIIYTYGYAEFIDQYANNYLLSVIPGYLNSQRVITYFLLLVELPIAALVGAIIAFYVPGLIFRRGRKSLGKLAFNISLVNKQYLNLTLSEYTKRSAIIVFGEIFLSLFTFGMPIIISISMMVFSRHKIAFHDYVLKFECIDTTVDKVFNSRDEIYLEKTKIKGEHIDFKLPQK